MNNAHLTTLQTHDMVKYKENNMELRDYQITTIKAIRSCGKAFDSWSDSDIATLYHSWSEETWCAGWMDTDGHDFYEYATTPPLILWQIKVLTKENNSQ